MNKLKIASIIFILIISVCCSHLQNSKNQIIIYDTIINLKPVGIKDLKPEYASFLKKLYNAVQNKDTTLMLSLVDDNIEIFAGGGVYGKRNFIDQFINDTTDNAWLNLSNLLKMGGYIQKSANLEEIIFPYQRSFLFYHNSEFLDTVFCSPYCIYFGIDSTVALYKEATCQSHIIAQLTYPILIELLDTINLSKKFMHVRTYDDKYNGWVLKSNVRSDADRLILIQKVKGELKIVTITPFD